MIELKRARNFQLTGLLLCLGAFGSVQQTALGQSYLNSQDFRPDSNPNSETTTRAPLSGKIQMTVDPTMRIDRSKLRKSAGIDSTAPEFQNNLRSLQPTVAPLVDPGAFQGQVQQVQKPAPILKAAAQAKDKTAPYIWYQSAMGGYYDASGTTKELVRAERLHLFGGRFEDGTPVPASPITDYNAMGHAYRQQKLNTTHFWGH